MTLAGLVFCKLYEFHIQPIYSIFYYIFSWNCNVIMYGFPFVYIGAMFARYQDWIINQAKNLFSVLIILYLAITMCGFSMYSIDRSLWGIPIGEIQAVILFLISLVCGDIRILRNASKIARNLSSIIFVTHTVFLTVSGVVLGVWNPYARFALVIGGSCILLGVLSTIKSDRLNTLFMVKI